MPEYYKYTSRIDINAFMYLDIALINYYHALQKYETLKQNGFLQDGEYLDSSIKEDIVVTIVFSSMALESYLNNYISGCIGDENYYKVFEKLSWIEKLRLIIQFIFRKEFNKDNVCFTLMKQLEKTRNELIHNKPMQYEFQSGLTLEEFEELEKSEEYQAHLELIMNYYNKQEIKDTMRKGFDSLRAVKEFSAFIDQNDSNANALSFLFRPQLIGEDEKDAAKRKIYPDLGIKTFEL